MKSERVARTKTSFYLNDDLRVRMSKLTLPGNQTQFINNLIEEGIERLEREKKRKKLLKILDSIKPVKSKETARKTLEKIRNEREKEIMRRVKN